MASEAEERSKYRNEASELVRLAHERMREKAWKREEARPKNIADGTLQGGGAALGGIIVGAGAIVLVPVVGTGVGAAKGSALASHPAGKAVGTVGGAVGGLVAGAIGGVVVGASAVIGGIGAGAYKVGEGTTNMFRGKQSPKSGMDNTETSFTVNEAERAEYEAMRDEMYAQIFGYSRPREAAPAAAEKVDVVDTTLYDALGVAVDADVVEIRKAYYRRAAATHPDKNPDDAEAHARFQKIGEAYQILSDSERRAVYDAKGLEAGGLQSDFVLDPEKLYVLMFGSEKFRHLIGDSALRYASLSAQPSRNQSFTERQTALAAEKSRQRERVNELALFLTARVEEFATSGDRMALMRWASLEAAVLKEEVFGLDILHAVGDAYVRKASQMLGYETSPLGIRGYFSALNETGHMFKLKNRALEGQFALAMGEQVEAVSREKEGREPETVDEAQERRAISSLGVAWLMSMVDIETTLREVVEKVCTELGVKREVLIGRARAILALGQIYSEA